MFTKTNFEIAGLLPTDPEAMVPTASGLYMSHEHTAITDGHMLVIVTAPERQPILFDQPDGLEEAEYFTPFVMDRESALKIGKSLPKRNKDAPENSMAMVDVHTEAESDSTLAVTEDIRRAVFKSVKRDGSKFPDLSRVIPLEGEEKFEIWLNPDLMGPLMKAFEKFCGDGFPCVKLRLYGPDKGIRLDAEANGQKMTAVVMPMRQSEDTGDR